MTNDLKLELFETLFMRTHSTTEQSKVLKTTLHCTNPILSHIISSEFYRYSSRMEKDEFMSSAMLFAWKTIESFDIMDGGTWEQMIDGTSEKNLGRLFYCIRKEIHYGSISLANPDLKRVYDSRVNIDFISLDATIENDGYTTSFGDNLPADASFWAAKEGYQAPPLIEWFLENKEAILTGGQLDYYDKMKTLDPTLSHEKRDGYKKEDVEGFVGVLHKSVTKRNKNVKNRTLRLWNRIKSEYGIRYIDRTLKDEKTKLESFLELETDQEYIDYVFKHRDKNFGDFLEQHLTPLEMTDINAGLNIPKDTLYRIVDIVINRLNEIEDCLNAPMADSFYLKEHEKRSNESQEQEERYKAFKSSQPCYVYDAEGNHIRTEKTEKVVHAIRKSLTTNGTILTKNIL